MPPPIVPPMFILLGDACADESNHWVLLFGLLLFFKRYRFFGSIMLLSITSNIFLMHLFLEPSELGELFYTGLLFGINIYIVIRNKESVQAIFDKSL